MKKWRVLISAPYMQPFIEDFRPFLEENNIEIVVPPVQERLEEEELLQWIPTMDGVICGDDRFTASVFRRAPRLKVVSKWGTGIDSIDIDAAKQLGVEVCNTPNAFSEPVADSVLGYMLCFARKLPWMDQAIKDGVWSKIPGVSLRECTLGVIGVGDVGKAVLRRAQAFGMRLLGHDIKPIASSFVQEVGLEVVEKHTLLAEADFVSINCDLNPTSYHLIREHELALMKPTAYLINTARGPIVHEVALVEALEGHKIAGAGLDVFEDEPLPPDSPLRRMDHVLLAPHNANSSPAAWQHVHENTIRNLLAVLNKETKQHA